MELSQNPHIKKSIDWLKTIQNPDGGWGMYDHDDSRIVTTAEAVTALAIAGIEGVAINKGINYLKTSGENLTWCKYVRHHAWIIYALVRAGKKEEIPERCFSALQRYHIQGAWGHEPRSRPDLFATFLALRALDISKRAKNITNESRQWISKQTKGKYWSFQSDQPSYAATSYAILSLATERSWQGSIYQSQIESAADFLKGGLISNCSLERTPKISGDLHYNYHHCSLSWAIMALLEAGVPCTDEVVMESLMKLYDHYYISSTGGWTEEEGHRPSVFATSHAIAAIEKYDKSLSIEDLLNNYSKLSNEYSTLVDTRILRNEVFIVHGHDGSVKHEVARFLELLGLKAIILEEQVDTGLTTIFQKLIDVSDKVAYAIIILTPDDMAEDDTGIRAARARQNAILELGFFLGKLGTNNVCLIKKGIIDIPSDIKGVLYIDIDSGDWKLLLVKKLKNAGLPIIINNLI